MNSYHEILTPKDTDMIYYPSICRLSIAHYEFLSCNFDTTPKDTDMIYYPSICRLSIAHYEFLSCNFDTKGYRHDLLPLNLPLINSPL